MKIFLSLFFVALSSVSEAYYLSGTQVCEMTEDSRVGEIGFTVDAPDVKVYAWTLKPFDPSLNSVIYFSGGPGESAHGFKFNFMDSWNVIYFDQRGIACSRPENEYLALSGSFYSSEQIARDADLIRQKLGIKKWSVYGHSYGTIPANIYASLFPESTQALVLEGTIFSGDDHLWNAPHRMKWLQHFYDHLTPELKKVVQQISKEETTKQVISQITFGFMYLDHPEQKLMEYLKQMQSIYEEQNTNQASLLGLEVPQPAELLAFSENNYKALTCRELSAMDINAGFLYNFENEKFTVDSSLLGQQTRIDGCKAFGIEAKNGLVKMYQAKDYLVKVPVTYFQGTTDGATEAPMAVRHYKVVPQGTAQLLLKVDAGHMPNLIPIAELAGSETFITEKPSPEAQKLQAQVFEKALLGQKIEKEILKQLNQLENAKWVSTNKNY